jgi:cytoskeletal protein CcmA (bactofilin family)
MTEIAGELISMDKNMGSIDKRLLSSRQMADTRIDFETSIRGNIDFDGIFYLDGALDGELRGKTGDKTTAVIGTRGRLTGNLHCRNAIIAGVVFGDIHAHSLELLAGARVLGDLYYETLAIDPAAEINGSFIPSDASTNHPELQRDKHAAR